MPTKSFAARMLVYLAGKRLYAAIVRLSKLYHGRYPDVSASRINTRSEAIERGAGYASVLRVTLAMAVACADKLSADISLETVTYALRDLCNTLRFDMRQLGVFILCFDPDPMIDSLVNRRAVLEVDNNHRHQAMKLVECAAEVLYEMLLARPQRP